jgi:hypothetical protein
MHASRMQVARLLCLQTSRAGWRQAQYLIDLHASCMHDGAQIYNTFQCVSDIWRQQRHTMMCLTKLSKAARHNQAYVTPPNLPSVSNVCTHDMVRYNVSLAFLGSSGGADGKHDIKLLKTCQAACHSRSWAAAAHWSLQG